MKCNKDEGKTLFQAIDAVDDKYLVETLEDMQKRKGQNHKQQFKHFDNGFKRHLCDRPYIK